MLTDSTRFTLLKLADESAEVIQEVTKVICYGTTSEFQGETIDHRAKLEAELGHLMYWVNQLVEAGVVREDRIIASIEEKTKWLSENSKITTIAK